MMRTFIGHFRQLSYPIPWRVPFAVLAAALILSWLGVQQTKTQREQFYAESASKRELSEQEKVYRAIRQNEFSTPRFSEVSWGLIFTAIVLMGVNWPRRAKAPERVVSEKTLP